MYKYNKLYNNILTKKLVKKDILDINKDTNKNTYNKIRDIKKFIESIYLNYGLDGIFSCELPIENPERGLKKYTPLIYHSAFNIYITYIQKLGFFVDVSPLKKDSVKYKELQKLNNLVLKAHILDIDTPQQRYIDSEKVVKQVAKILTMECNYISTLFISNWYLDFDSIDRYYKTDYSINI